MSSSTTKATGEQDKTPVDEDPPFWARMCDGEHALEGIEWAIRDLKKAHDKALDRAVMRAWFDPFGGAEAMHAIRELVTIRQHLAVANLLKQRTEELLAKLRSKAA